MEKQRAVGGLNPPTASIRVSETLHLPFTAAVSGPPNVPSALGPFRWMIIVVRNGHTNVIAGYDLIMRIKRALNLC